MIRSPRDLANQKIQLRKQQEALLRDLLTVVDALDRAADHWHQADETHRPAQPGVAPTTTCWQRWRQWLSLCPLINPSTRPDQPETLAAVVTSARQGIDMIRESMLTVLSQHQVVPYPPKGIPLTRPRCTPSGNG